jgi:hypothetical protein
VLQWNQNHAFPEIQAGWKESWAEMKYILQISISVGLLLLASCRPAQNPTPTAMQSTRILASTATSPGRVFTPQASNTPWIFPSGLSIEEDPLAKPPEIEPLVILPLDGLTQAEVIDRHKSDWGETFSPYEYYSVGGGDLWVMQGNDKLEAAWGPTENGKVTARVTRNGNVIFSMVINPPGTTSPTRVLTVYADHWLFETAQKKTPSPPTTRFVDSFFKGEIFVDGQSLNFYKRAGKTGVSFDGQDIPLGYDGVWHYGCCSGGELNPRMAENFIGFFAWRADQWYYTGIGVFGQPGRN